MKGHIRSWWHVAVVCGINIICIPLLTQLVWVIVQGDPFMWRRVFPKPVVFQFKGLGIPLAIVVISIPTIIGLQLIRWLPARRMGLSLVTALTDTWARLGVPRRAWVWRAGAAVLVATAITIGAGWLVPEKAASAILAQRLVKWFDDPGAQAAARTPPTTLTAIQQQAIAALQVPPNIAGVTTPAVVPNVLIWTERIHDGLTVGIGTALAILVFQVLSTRVRRRDGFLRCLRCDHILKGLSEPRCPECGETI